MELITQYFSDLTPKQFQQFAQLDALYQLWNAKINVISRKDIDGFYERHVLHSLGIAKIMPFLDGTTVLDVGTGGGFPGIPLAILYPNVRFTLIDSIGKKIKVVEEVAQALGLKNVVAIHCRAEQLPQKFDFIVSRAVTRLAEFCSWTENSINHQSKNALKNGILYLKGGDLTQELEEANQKTVVYPLKDIYATEFFETKVVVYVPRKIWFGSV